MTAAGTSLWSEESNSRLRELHGQNYSFGIIASILSAEFNKPVTRNAAIGRAIRMGLERRRASSITVTRRAPARAPKTPKIKIAPQPILGEIELRDADVKARRVLLHDLQFGECKYPYGDGPFTFCALPAREGECYCAAHFALTHNFEPRRWARHRRVSRFGALRALEVV